MDGQENEGFWRKVVKIEFNHLFAFFDCLSFPFTDSLHYKGMYYLESNRKVGKMNEGKKMDRNLYK
jgi:hypothetical protein